jgi:hypothetical protein
MFDYDSIKRLAKTIKRPVKQLLALAPVNDPFYAGVGHRGEAAKWFARIWSEHGALGAHLRRIHYRLVSPPAGVRFLLPNGREYQNTENDWTFLCSASLAARYLDLVPFDGLTDRRNDEPRLFALNPQLDPNEGRVVSSEVLFDEPEIEAPEFPTLPEIHIFELDDDAVRQGFVVEVWIEKSTQNDWLVPLCSRRGVNLVVGIGEQSETRSRELALRSAKYAVPTRIIYISDFDPGGRSMPKAVARKVEFTIAKFDLDVNIQFIPLALSPDQCREYKLPRTPIKDTESRKDKFERTFGVGATELDALEALHPGELARLLEAEIDNFLDADLKRRVQHAYRDQMLPLDKIEHEVRAEHAEEIEETEGRFERIMSDLDELKEEAGALWQTMTEEMEERLPDLSDIEIPRSEAPGETDSFILYDSKRDYFTQMDFYNAWRDGADHADDQAAP